LSLPYLAMVSTCLLRASLIHLLPTHIQSRSTVLLAGSFLYYATAMHVQSVSAGCVKSASTFSSANTREAGLQDAHAATPLAASLSHFNLTFDELVTNNFLSYNTHILSIIYRRWELIIIALAPLCGLLIDIASSAGQMTLALVTWALHRPR
jgi:hypothetical protein